jgi:hypothetical protein
MPSAKFADRVESYWQKMGRLKLWSGVLGMRALEQTQQETQKNREAESRWARRNLWQEGCQPGQASQGQGDEMGHTFLGDVLMPQQQPPQQQGSGIGKVLAGAALGASLLGVPGAGIAGYLLSQMNQQKETPSTSPAVVNDGETVDLGLKKIEDLEL